MRRSVYYPRLFVHDSLADFFFRDWDSVPPTRPTAAHGGMPGDRVPVEADGEEQPQPVVVQVWKPCPTRLTRLMSALTASVGSLLTPRRPVGVQ